MTLPAGARLGPYELLSAIGAGGMGEVYRARDTRLGRVVALKVLSEEFAADSDRLRRFEQEARAASALNHPAIVVVHDVGRSGSISYMALELVQGRTLRELVTSGPLPVKRILALGTQLAEGLARAHASGIIHRDLKPENVMVTDEGLVKILDFGLARVALRSAEQLVASPTVSVPSPGTKSGVVLGTVGYMSPEQAAGRTVDHRSDQFSLGAVLYEMAAGRRAFQRDSPAQTLAAIIDEEPAPIAASRPDAPAPLLWIIDRCLTKSPSERYESTLDLARELATLKDRLPGTSIEPRPAGNRSDWTRRATMIAALAIVGVGLAAALRVGWRAEGTPPLHWERLSFRRGMIWSARFARDGRTIVYSAAWDGEPVRLFETHLGATETRALDLPPGKVLSVSPSGDLAFLRDPRFVFFFYQPGTLAQSTLEGGAPRDLLEDVHAADWSADGATLAVARGVKGGDRLEYPIGKTLYETDHWISELRISRDGEWIAFLEHGDAASLMAIGVKDRRRRILSENWLVSSGGFA